MVSFARSWEARLDLLRILIVGPSGTPYEHAPFVIDMHFNPSFPALPPDTYFHSWTYNAGRINPNLYECGKICLSPFWAHGPPTRAMRVGRPASPACCRSLSVCWVLSWSRSHTTVSVPESRLPNPDIVYDDLSAFGSSTTLARVSCPRSSMM